MTPQAVNRPAGDGDSPRRILRCGVPWNGAWYRSPDLDRVVGRTGLVRELPDDPNHIWVLADDQPILARRKDIGSAEIGLLRHR